MATIKSFSGKELQEMVDETKKLRKTIEDERANVEAELKDTGLGGDAKEYLESSVKAINDMLTQLETKIKDDFEAKLDAEQEDEKSILERVKKEWNA